MHSGRFGEVWKYQHQGREVAVKVLRSHATSDLELIARVGHQHSPFYTSSSTTDERLHRGSARNSSKGRIFGTRTYCLFWE